MTENLYNNVKLKTFAEACLILCCLLNNVENTKEVVINHDDKKCFVVAVYY